MRSNERWVFGFFMILTIIMIALSLACDGTGGNELIEPTTYSISGQATSDGTGLSGVTVTLSGTSSGTATTDNNGNYTFTGLSNGSYKITPSLTNYTFDPPYSDITIAGSNQTNVNFTTAASISGQVTTNGTGLSDVTITLSGNSSGTATTDNNGNYTFTGLSNGSHKITPSLYGYSFYPQYRDITITGSNQTNINFIEDHPPSIFITSPIGLSSYSTKISTINLSGFAADDIEIDVITWINDQGGSGIAAGTDEWLISDILLQPGDNLITVTATDVGGNTANDSISVTYNPYLEFLSAPQAFPDAFFVNEETEVIFRVAIENNPNLDPTGVKLLQVDDNNNIIETLTTLADDGNIYNGDDIEGDGVFSGKTNFKESIVSLIRLRVSADITEALEIVTAYSEVFNLSVINHLTNAEFSKAFNMPNETQQKYEELEAIYGEEEGKTKTVEWLETQPEIVQAGIAESGEGIWYLLNSGVLGGIILHPEGTEGERTVYVPAKSLVAQGLNYKSCKSELRLRKLPGLEMLSSEGTKIGIDSKNILVIAPFNWQWQNWGTAFEENVYNMFNDITCPSFNVTKIYDASASIEAFKNISNYGVVVLHTHGDTFYSNAVLQWLHQNLSLDFDFVGPQVIFLTGEEPTDASKTTYEIDLKRGRLAIISGYFAVTPCFIRYYNKSFPDSLIYNGSCRGMYNDSMSSAFLGNGSRTYFGFSEYVLSTYDRDIAVTLFDSFVNQEKTTGESFYDAVSAHGSNDGQVTDPAYFIMRGNSDLTIKAEVIINGTFEEGNMNGWTGGGDKRIISQLGPLSPKEGIYMNIISTGLGAIDDSNSYIEQTFCIPAGVTTLSLDYNVVSEEPMEFVGTIFDDKFQVTLTTSSGTTTIAYESINTSSWISVSGINFYGGDNTTYMTGWKHIAFDVSGLAGNEPVTLKFHTWDKGDSIYDTAALIDNIKLE